MTQNPPSARLGRRSFARAILHLALVVTPPYATAQSPQVDDPFFVSKGAWGQGFDDQWGLKRIGFGAPDARDSAWARSAEATQPVVVAVVDTGLDWRHPDFNNANLWRNAGERENGIDDDGNGYVDDLIGWNFLDQDNNPWDLAGHGTFVTGIIAAATGNGEGIAGINGHARIMPLKALSFMGAGRATIVAEAIYYAVRNGARIINLSLGSPRFSAAEERAIRHANEQGVLVIVASGNDGGDIVDFGPAGSPNVITVAASTSDDQRAGYSNFGQQVDITAPGSDILSLRARRTDFILMTLPLNYEPGGAFVGQEGRYYRASGTSFAAPFVSAVASLLWSRNPDLSAEQVRRILLQSARDIDAPGVDQNTGYGLLDASAALAADPEFHVDAAITGVAVVQRGQSVLLQITGTADADRLEGAVIEAGPGENPTSWTPISRKIASPVRDDVLDEVDARTFASGKQWTLRLTTTHKNGKQRQARFVVNVG